jgi:tetratricopeptide (TPR) repeat protein
MIQNWKYILALSASFIATAGMAQTVQDAQRAIDLERYNEAKATLRRLNNDEANYYLGDLYLKTNKPDSAAVFFNQGLAKNSKSALNMVGLGKIALMQGNTAEAERQFDAAVKQTKGKDANVFKQIGQAYADAPNVKDINKAVSYMNEANKNTKNNDAAAYITLGDVHLKDPNGGGNAMTAYDRAIQIDPNNAKAYLRRGQLFVRSKNYNEAQAAFEKAISINANYAPAYRELGDLYARVGKYDQAVELTKKYRSMAENSVETQVTYAKLLFLIEDYPGTITEAQQVLQRDPNNIEMNRLMALSLYKTKKNAEALQTIEKYIKSADPTKLIASDYAYYGRILAANGNSADAMANLEKALTMDPENAELQEDVADAYKEAKNYPKAIAIYRTRLAAKPSLVESAKLADVYIAAQKYQSADSIYSEIIKAKPDYMTSYIRRAEILDAQDPKQTGKSKAAWEEFLRVATADASKAPSTYVKANMFKANYYLGFLSYQDKDYTTAKKYWNEAKRLDPSNKDVDTALKNIDVAQKRTSSARK